MRKMTFLGLDLSEKRSGHTLAVEATMLAVVAGIFVEVARTKAVC